MWDPYYPHMYRSIPVPLVFPDIVRYSVVASLAGELCVNVFDVKVEPTVLGDRSDSILFVAKDILTNWTEHILPILTDVYVAQEVRWVDLDSLDGSTGSTSESDTEEWPQPGGNGASAPLPNNAYYKIRKVLDGGGRQSRSGMVRLGGATESATTPGAPNVLTATYVTDLAAAFESFKDGINGVELDTTINMGVLHTVEGQATGFTFISEFQPLSSVGTLRRRMPGYGD